MERGQIDPAIAKFSGMLDKRPHHPTLLYYLGTCYLNKGQSGIAANLLMAAIQKKPGFFDAMCNLGVAYRNELLNDEAKQVWEAAIALKPDAGVYSNLGGLYINAGQPQKALEYYDKALKLDPESAHTHSNRALAFLETARWKEGWDEYEWGITLGSRRVKNYGLPKWEGGKNEVVVVMGEQGIGDEIMFASMLPDLIAISKKVVIDCHPRLPALFKRSFPTCDVRPTRKSPDGTWGKREYPDGKWINIGSLGKFFRPDVSSFPRKPYLLAERKSFRGIGLAWAGGTKNTNAKDRSLTLDQLTPILDKDKTYYSLQYTAEAARDVCQFEGDKGIAIKHWPKYVECFDYSVTADFISGLDKIIAVNTTIVHLAGALGIPCWVLTPKRVAWRYGSSGDTMPWYGSCKMFRQEKDGDWGPVLARVKEQLKNG
jgi:hypothetical protein